MREILFRGKRLDNGEWVYSQTVFSHLDIFYIPAQNLECTVMRNLDTVGNISEIRCKDGKYFFKVQTETIGQFTGLTDKNGKKVFEGDVVKIVPDYDYSDDYSISKVYSYNGIFCVDYHGDDFDSTALGFLEDYLPDGDFEVIGNICDNPELLEVRE